MIQRMRQGTHRAIGMALAVIFAVGMTVLLMPACDKLGLGGTGGDGSGGGADALASADQAQVALAAAQAEYMASLLENMIQQNVADPSSVDDATLQALADQYAPEAAATVATWAKTLDPSTIALLTIDHEKILACMDKFGCKDVEECPFSKRCWLVDCGDAKCSTCPIPPSFQPTKLLFKGWSAYTCLGFGAPPPVVGWKVIIHFRGGYNWPYCWNIANDH